MLSDGLTKSPMFLPPSGKTKSQKRQIYIIDGRYQSLLSLICVFHSEYLVLLISIWLYTCYFMKRACYCYFVGRDADGLMEASNQEPAIVLIVGMTVSQYLGLTLSPLFLYCPVVFFFPDLC
jgi:hypothetical protein